MFKLTYLLTLKYCWGEPVRTHCWERLKVSNQMTILQFTPMDIEQDMRSDDENDDEYMLV